jgi:2',3'-cyclic-nucleotide 2'-phosphodiesterase (5'-nucleotidase family)
MLFTALSLAGLTGCAGRVAPEPVYEGEPRKLAVVAINDVYRIGGLLGSDRGGISRVRALRAELEDEGWDVLLLHAGDALSPSLLGKQFQGAQMVDVLNGLDGDFEAFDEQLFVTFGNHEFDLDAEALDARIAESGFRWLGTNVRFALDEDGAPQVAGGQLVRSALVEVGGATVGVFGLTTPVKKPGYVAAIDDDYEGLARWYTETLRGAGADVVIGLTHLDAAQDEAILQALGDEGPDLILGGHDHVRLERRARGRMALKADADAVSALLVRIYVGDQGELAIGRDWIDLGPEAPQRDAAIEARVAEWMDRYAEVYCPSVGAEPGCLTEELGRAGVDLVARESEIRRYETNLGDLAADTALAAFAEQGAQVALINSGSLRLNEDIGAGVALTRRHVEELLPFGSPLRLIRIDGATLQAAVDHAVESWTGSGHWLQVAGVTYVHDPEAGTATGLALLTEEGPRAVAPEEEILAVVGAYMLEPGWGDQDGYTMLSKEMVVEEGPDLKALMVGAFAGEVAPEVEGRICNTQREGPCLAAE